MAKAHLPPVPPANQAPQGGDTPGQGGDMPPAVAKKAEASKDGNLDIQGQAGNRAENTAQRNLKR